MTPYLRNLALAPKRPLPDDQPNIPFDLGFAACLDGLAHLGEDDKESEEPTH